MRGARPAPGYTPIVASVAINDRDVSPDEAATRLLEEQSEWLLAFCTRQLRDRDDAEDAVQATFLYAFRALRRGVVPEFERAWQAGRLLSLGNAMSAALDALWDPSIVPASSVAPE